MSWTSFSVGLVKLMLCARTGRTAKRMAEATGFPGYDGKHQGRNTVARLPAKGHA